MNKINTLRCRYIGTYSYDLKMKLTTFLFMAMLFQINANTYSQNTRITIDMDGVRVEDVLAKIEKLTEFKFFVDTKKIDLQRKVSVRANRKTVSNVLNELFTGTNVTYEVFNKQIILNKEVNNSLKNNVSSFKNELKTIIQFQVSGTVTDSQGIPLSGANIVEKGTINGKIADFDGNFTIDVANEDATLVVSYLGFATKEVAVNGQINFNIFLEESTSGLEEVVVVGYGTQKKSDLTGAVGSLKGSDMEQLAVPNVGEALQGRLAGVLVSQTGRVGDGPSILIRGLNTINNNSPLVIIDGIAGDLSLVDENDVASIEVLKDASSAAIYGSRGANGVIIITTKRGKEGKTKLSFSTYGGVEVLTDKIDMLNRDQHKKVYSSAYLNDGLEIPAALNDPDYQNDTDWQDELYQTGFIQKYSLQMGSGNETSTYNLSMNYLDKGSVIPGDYLKRASARLNSDFKLGKLTIKESLQVGREWTDRSNLDQQTLLRTIPGLGVHAPDNGTNFGYSISNTEALNPLAINELERTQYSKDFIFGNLSFNYEFFDGFSYNLLTGVRLDNYHTMQFSPYYVIQVGRPSRSSLFENRGNTTYTNIENTLNYTKHFGGHNVVALIGYTEELWKYRNMTGSGQDLPSNTVTTLNGVTDNISVGGTETPQGIRSWLGRITYNYEGKYLLNGSIRRDDTSKFARGYSVGVFPSVSAGWVVSKESFFPEGAITNFKLRASYGQLGNQFTDDFQYTPFINSGFYYPIGGNLANGAIATNLANPRIQWETTTNKDFGLNLELFDGKLYVESDYYMNKTEDILISVPLPPSIGAGSPDQNAATVESKGFELAVGYKTLFQDGKINIQANMSTETNEVTHLGRGEPISGSGGVTRIDQGHTINELYVWQDDGLFQTQAELDENAAFQPNAQLGDVKFVDVNGDKILNDDDRIYLGSGLPDFYYGLTADVVFKQFDFSIQVNGQQGGKVFNELRRRWFEYPRSDLWNQTTALLNAWTPQNTNTDIPRLTINNQNINTRQSTRFVEDASFFRLRNIQAGYTFNEQQVQTIQKIRLYIAAQNLFTISGFDYYDPDRGGSGVLNQINLIPKTFYIGIQASF